GSDDGILRISDPPYYTACPNPFLPDFIRHYGKSYDPSTTYTREPFAADVSEGKNDPIYNAHAYHTKVPYSAIVRYILHYTNPGDVVLDFFAGTGMTGVAVNTCANPPSILRETVRQEQPDIQWGLRRAILVDISPAASSIAAGFTRPFDSSTFKIKASNL